MLAGLYSALSQDVPTLKNEAHSNQTLFRWYCIMDHICISFNKIKVMI